MLPPALATVALVLPTVLPTVTAPPDPSQTPSPDPGPDLEAAAGAVTGGVAVVLAIAAALVVALLLAEIGSALTRAIGRRSRLAEGIAIRARLPLRALLAVVLVWVGLLVATPDGADRPGWLDPVEHTLLIGTILSAAWLVGVLAFVVEDAALARWRIGAGDDRHARRLRTQISVLRRLTVVVLVVVALAAALLTFQGARQWGAGLLASAGLVSVVVGFAAQSSLSNLFAGLQLAFTDAIRLDDVVVVDGYWGRIEEITLTYVVVHVWDDRRLIVPSTSFTSTAFENWTRRAADLVGAVELDVDWSVPVGPMRAELARLLQASPLWDHRVGVLQVTDATEGRVRVRALASAADAPTLFDLRCQVREGLVRWLQREHPEALPRTRWEVDGGPGAPGRAVTGEHAVTGERPVTGEHAVTGERPAALDRPAAERPAGTARHATAPIPIGAAGAPPADDPGHLVADRTERIDPAELARIAEADAAGGEGLFTGSLEAIERSKAFTGPGLEVIAQREHHAEGLRRPEDDVHRPEGDPRRAQDEPRPPVRERRVD